MRQSSAVLGIGGASSHAPKATRQPLDGSLYSAAKDPSYIFSLRDDEEAFLLDEALWRLDASSSLTLKEEEEAFLLNADPLFVLVPDDNLLIHELENLSLVDSLRDRWHFLHSDEEGWFYSDLD